ncbi:glutaredoxin family protein [Lacisediminihabitans profunda]|nr:glutaredoxin family protein [Lacisediminihabitans profunda]
MTAIRLFGTPTCADCARSRAALRDAGIPFDDIDIAENADAAAMAEEISGRRSTPVIVFTDGSFLVEPTNSELLETARRFL